MDDLSERRQRQRIMVDPAFRLVCDGAPVEVRDVSLDGFAIVAGTAPDARQMFAFRLEHQRLDGVVSGTAQVVNYVRGATAESGLAGCRIVALDEGGEVRLAHWLAEHVARVASVPVSALEAEQIVAGPSLV